jgi:hypothetical protein
MSEKSSRMGRPFPAPLVTEEWYKKQEVLKLKKIRVKVRRTIKWLLILWVVFGGELALINDGHPALSVMWILSVVACVGAWTFSDAIES